MILLLAFFSIIVRAQAWLRAYEPRSRTERASFC
jgi:hypothetical protein